MNSIKNNKMLDLLVRNSIDKSIFLNETYDCMIVSVFEALIDEMHNVEYRNIIKNRIRNSEDRILTIKNLVKEKNGMYY